MSKPRSLWRQGSLPLFPTLLILLATLCPWQQGWSQTRGSRTEPVDLKAYATVLYVNGSTAQASGEGSKENPFPRLQSALAATKEQPGPVAVLVAAGTYREGTLELPEAVHLFGGFEAGSWNRNIHTHPTILDGELQGRVLISRAGGSIDGFHIIQGQVAGYGAGILCQGSSPAITNNYFRENRVLAPRDWEPKFRHELAWDGAAIACIEGSNPLIANNTLLFNETDIGRGAGITVHLNSHPEIRNNVIMHNVVGLTDPKRSSDGGGVSIYGYCDPLVENNLIAMNRALTKNDAGGMFVALWANPVIRGNHFLGNIGDDDAGGLFIGGQEHRYERPFDPVPDPEEFDILVEDNVFMGNRNASENSGAMRITMETRGRLVNNLSARNIGGVYLQRSELSFFHNTLDDDLLMVETKDTLLPSDVRNNIILGKTELYAPTRFTHNATRNFTYGEGNFVVSKMNPGFIEDGFTAAVTQKRYLPVEGKTIVDLMRENPIEQDLTNRIIRIEDFWSVVAEHDGLRVIVYGRVPDFSEKGTNPYLEILPTYQLKEDSPFIDRGTPVLEITRDMKGNPRPSEAGEDLPDLGAYEYQP